MANYFDLFKSDYNNNDYDYSYDDDYDFDSYGIDNNFYISDVNPPYMSYGYNKIKNLFQDLYDNDWDDFVAADDSEDEEDIVETNNPTVTSSIVVEDTSDDKKKQSKKKGGKIPMGYEGMRMKLFHDMVNYAELNRAKASERQEQQEEESSNNNDNISTTASFSVDFNPDEYFSTSNNPDSNKDKYVFTEKLFNGMGNEIDIAADFIKKKEGFSPKYIGDADGASIGYGFFTKKPDLKKTMTRDEADAILHDKLISEFEPYLKRYVPDYNSLNDNMKAALLSYIYNVGPGNFNKQTKLLEAISNKDWESAAGYIRNGIRTSQGKVLNGLVRRRNEEAELFLS